MRAIGYIRVSTDKQDNSADAQEKKIRATAMLRDFDLIDTVIDIDEFSGDLNRPGAQQVLEMVRAEKIDAVIITKLDRLTRSTRDVIELMELFGKHHVAFISISEDLNTETPIGRFVVRLIASIGELEREMIGSRTSEGLQNLKAQGFPAGPAPFGYKAQKRTAHEKENKIRKPLLEDDLEQQIIKRITDLYAGGLDQLRKKQEVPKDIGLWPGIAMVLNREGFRTRSGGEWVYQRVYRTFKDVISKKN